VVCAGGVWGHWEKNSRQGEGQRDEFSLFL